MKWVHSESWMSRLAAFKSSGFATDFFPEEFSLAEEDAMFCCAASDCLWDDYPQIVLRGVNNEG